MVGVGKHCLLILCHPVGWFGALCIKPLSQDTCIMNRPRPLHDTVCDDEVSIAHKLDVDAAPPLSVDVLPIPLMRCLDMHMSAVNNPNSIGHVPQKKKLVLGLGNLDILWK